MATPLITALQKAKPLITKTSLKVQIGELTIPLKKKEFLGVLLTEYRHLLEAEAEDWKSGVTIDTDFAGSGAIDGPVFVIQDTKTESEEEQRFVFTGFYPTSESKQEEASDDLNVPPQIEQIVTWDELKAWFEFVLVASGKLDEILAIEEEVRKEYEKVNAESEENEEEQGDKITSVDIGDISIYPSSSIDYRAMWVENTKDNISIQIAFEDLHAISYFIDFGHKPKEVHSVYRDSTDEYLELSWGKKNLKLAFISGEKSATVKLSREEAEKLSEQIAIIQENGHLL